MHGFYIVIEGIDGSGKDTLTNFLLGKLSSEKVCFDFRKSFANPKSVLEGFVFVSEPSSLDSGIKVRNLIKKKADSKTLAKAFSDDRLNLLKNFVEPWLSKGVSVVSVRSFLSSLVYQSIGFNYNLDFLLNLEGNSFAMRNSPDLFVILKSSVSSVLNRIKFRSDLEFFERKDFLRKVYSIYDNETPLSFNGKTYFLKELVEDVFKSRVVYFDNSNSLGDLENFSQRIVEDYLLSN